MSTTPRTDAAKALAAIPFEAQECVLMDEVVPASFARQLERELQEARMDAARYRWLRDHGGKSYQETASQPAGILPCIFMRFPSLNESGSYVLRSESADAAIDLAMASDPPAK